MKKTNKANRYLNICTVLVFSIIVVLMTVFHFSYELENITEDLLYQRAGSIKNDIKIIAVDEETLDQLGPYTDWDRIYFARLIDMLGESENRPSVIAVDFIFSGTNDSASDMALVETVKKHGNVVLASKLEASDMLIKDGSNNYATKEYIKDEVTAFDELNKVSYPGFTTPIFDEDGYIRSCFGRIESEGKEYESFCFRVATLCGYTGNLEQCEYIYSGKPGDFEIIPMSKVLDKSVPASYFKDSIVLIGAYEEGMMDAYQTPIDHSTNMYGVEIHANQIEALLADKIIHPVSVLIQCVLAVALVVAIGLYVFKARIKNGVAISFVGALLYVLFCYSLFHFTSFKLCVTYIPVVIIAQFFTVLIIRYIRSQKERAEEIQKVLFSMADSMAEAIEGRTPYNASHTKNVAKRCLEMLDFINTMHQNGKSDLHFTENDKRQLYLAAMLHDIGKMDIPIEIMDKPTRLGSRVEGLRSRLKIIQLYLQIDILKGLGSEADCKKEIEDIDIFLSKLDSYDCGRPLKEDELAFINDFATRKYVCEDSNVIPYLLEEELEDLHIKAGTLSDRERKIVQGHVEYTDKILSRVYFGNEFDKVRKMAADHHELLNKQGYPKQKGSDELDVMTRILTVMDIYDSLIADDRPYKKAKSVEVAFEILDEEASEGKLDKDIVEIAKQIYLTEKK